MNILYVGGLAIPIRDILTGKTENEITGWPAYFQPVYQLIKAGHNVDFVMFSDLERFNISVDWFSEKQIIQNVYIDENKRKRFGIISKLYYKVYNSLKFITSIRKAVKEKQYDFIYCQEIPGFWGNVIANIYKIPCGVRVYGDTFYLRGKVCSKYEFIQKYGKLGLLIAYPQMYILYKLKKSFMLTTADGTHGDLTYQLLKPKRNPYPLYYWKTGVKKVQPVPDEKLEQKINGLEYIAYPARIDTIKRQDIAIDILAMIHAKGQPLHLFLIGESSNQGYYNSLIEKTRQYGLEEYVHFTGGVTQNQVKVYAKNAIAGILTSDLSNRGNVFFELFSIGVPIVSFDDGSLDEYIVNEYSGFLAKDCEQMADYVIELFNDPEKRNAVSSNAIKTADEKVLSEEDRFRLEVELIEAYASGKQDRVFPDRI